MTATQLARWQRIIVLAHVLLAMLYGAVIPPYEAHDETGHFAYVQHLLTRRALPDARDTDKAFLDQSHQPPLYYLITAALTAWSAPEAGVPPRNLFAFDGSNRRGVRILLRQPGEDFPWRGATLALHAARMVSTLLSALMIIVIASAARLLFAESPVAALLATAIAAFNPQVLFMAAMVNNDVMVSLLGACVAYGALRLASPAPKPRDCISFGLALGLSLASKNSALALLGFAAGALALIAWRRRWPLPALLGRGALVYGAAALVAAPHYLYNIIRYGQLLVDREADNKILTAQNLFVEGVAVGLRDAWLPRLFTNAFRTFWGTFGWGNVQQPDWAYWLVFAFCCIGVLAALSALRRAGFEQRTGLLLMAGLAGAMLILPTYRAISFQDPALLPGRYLMPSLLAHASLLGYGWHAVAARLPSLRRVVPAAFAGWALAVPLLLLRPAYTPVLEVAGSAAPIITFGDVATVHAIDAREIYLPDREGMRQYARVRVTWSALRPTEQPYAIGVSVLGRNNEVLGSMNVYPQRGNYPSTVWRAGTVFTDEYDVLLEKPCAQLPALGRVALALFTVDVDPETRAVVPLEQLPATDAENRPVAPIIGRFRIGSPPLPYPIWWQEPRARFDGAIGLRDVSLPKQAQAGAPVTVSLALESLREIDRDATIFVHALDARGRLIAQRDQAPFGGANPSSLWMPGECAREAVTLDLPADAAGTLRVVAGLYDKQGRLAATTAFDARQPRFTDDIVELGRIQVQP